MSNEKSQAAVAGQPTDIPTSRGRPLGSWHYLFVFRKGLDRNAFNMEEITSCHHALAEDGLEVDGPRCRHTAGIKETFQSLFLAHCRGDKDLNLRKAAKEVLQR